MLNACSGERPVLGVKDGLLTACPSSPNCVSSFAADERHGIAALAFRDDAEAAFSRLERVLRTRDDTRIVEKREGYLRVELRTTLFVDDGEFLLDRERQAIQVRSASRVGYSDLGKNRRRLEEIRRGFEAEAPSRGAGASGRDR
ncbi:MAG: DUF1499 domain-containing protein [Deltaproteobacteria bacterium]|nr:MAG: DUF1499 domain-containing protein [Deltaproteobacteria bacterium]